MSTWPLLAASTRGATTMSAEKQPFSRPWASTATGVEGRPWSELV